MQQYNNISFGAKFIPTEPLIKSLNEASKKMYAVQDLRTLVKSLNIILNDGSKDTIIIKDEVGKMHKMSASINGQKKFEIRYIPNNDKARIGATLKILKNIAKRNNPSYNFTNLSDKELINIIPESLKLKKLVDKKFATTQILDIFENIKKIQDRIQKKILNLNLKEINKLSDKILKQKTQI